MRFFKSTLIAFSTVIFLCFFSSRVMAQQKTVTIQPEKPAPGDTVTITYHPNSPDAAIKSPGHIELLFSFAPFQYSQPYHFDMQKTDSGWTAEVPLSKQFKYASFHFSSGKEVDKNIDGHEYELFAYKNNKPVKMAYLMEAHSLKKRYPDASHHKLSDLRAKLYRKEIQFHPNSYNAQMKLYHYQLKQDNADSSIILKKAHKRINQELARNPHSYLTVKSAKFGYLLIGEKTKGDSLQKAIIKEYPRSDFAMYHLYHRAKKEKDKNMQARMIRKYINTNYQPSWVNKLFTGQAYKLLFLYYAKHDSIKQMKKIAKLWLNPKPGIFQKPVKSIDYNTAARAIAKNTDEYIWARQYAQKALHLASYEPVLKFRVTKDGFSPVYIPEKKKQKLLKKRKSKILTTIGLIYMKQKKYRKAKANLIQAEEISRKGDAKKYLVQLAKIYEQQHQPETAYHIYQKLALFHLAEKELQAKLKQSYIAYSGSEDGFKKQVIALHKKRHQGMVRKVAKERINKKAPSLAHAINLSGTPLNTETLAGKVVVLDFWSTWCGYCRALFSQLQKVKEQFKNNRDVKFIALNSGWRNSRKQAKQWVKKQHYTLSFFYDKDSKITDAYGVIALPTTFIIDKNGSIQFKDVGYRGPSMEKTLALKIDMALGKEKAVGEPDK
jgi:thiol-disulfide isomerase/thioredoxin